MPTTTNITVTACDNELYLIALPTTSPTNFGGSEIAHITSGFNNPVEYSVTPQSILSAGQYTLVMVGINWGGPQAFTVKLTTGGVVNTYTAPAGTNIGATWTQAIPMTV
ncbi:MAG TPA: hypothetical protein VN659_07455 [Pyrinomonadaceae bacterium]|nr:hypothetical protein [Pyrinomonadaceae bacterium]